MHLNYSQRLGPNEHRPDCLPSEHDWTEPSSDPLGHILGEWRDCRRCGRQEYRDDAGQPWTLAISRHIDD